MTSAGGRRGGATSTAERRWALRQANRAHHGCEHAATDDCGREARRRRIRRLLRAPHMRIRLRWGVSGTDTDDATSDPARILHR
uniref:Uncharacterized protein n=1 Tax=Oryza rufipogon TaxID=4529 RepID=A0A0E0QXK1_ORYRU